MPDEVLESLGPVSRPGFTAYLRARTARWTAVVGGPSTLEELQPDRVVRLEAGHVVHRGGGCVRGVAIETSRTFWRSRTGRCS